MMVLQWVTQYDVKTGEEIARYENVNQAAIATGAQANVIWKVIQGRCKHANGYLFKKESVDKEIFKNKKILTLDEYLFLNDMNVTKFAKTFGLDASSISQCNNGNRKPSKNIRKKLTELGVVFKTESGVVLSKCDKYLPNAFENKAEIKMIVLKAIRKKKKGRILVGNVDEGKVASLFLTELNICNYVGYKEEIGFFVKYDTGIKK